MKKDIHPEYKETTITCACGNVIHTRSTKGNIRVEICSSCHPFFTGKQKLVDTAGRVERFRRKYGLAAEEEISAPEEISPASTAQEPVEENVQVEESAGDGPKQEPSDKKSEEQ